LEAFANCVPCIEIRKKTGDNLVLKMKLFVCILLVSVMALPQAGFAITEDHKATITSFFAFVSYDDPTKVTFILDVDPFLEPGNGPRFFPFDDNVLYSINIDNNNDAVGDIVFQFQFTTTIRNPSVPGAFLGAGAGINAPANSPAPVAPGTPIIPPAITALNGAGSAGLGLQQQYTVTMIKGGVSTPLTNSNGGSLFAVPTNVGPRTMPNYPALAAQGIYTLSDGVRVFAGTTDEPLFADLGGLYDSLNFRTGAGGGVLTAAADADDFVNTASDYFSGYNVNSIAIEVPVSMLTSTSALGRAVVPHAPMVAAGLVAGRERWFFGLRCLRFTPAVFPRSSGWVIHSSAIC
jgi:hypothetical protein